MIANQTPKTQSNPRPSKTTRPNSIFVGGIPQNSNARSLRLTFSRFGAIRNVVLPRDPKNRKKLMGFCIVKFIDAEAVKLALEAREVIFNGKVASIKECVPLHQAGKKDAEVNKVFARNIPSTTSELRVREAFRDKFGTVEHVRLILDHATRKPRGFGYVKMADRKGYLRAVEAGVLQLDGQQVEIVPSRSTLENNFKSPKNENGNNNKIEDLSGQKIKQNIQDPGTTDAPKEQKRELPSNIAANRSSRRKNRTPGSMAEAKEALNRSNRQTDSRDIILNHEQVIVVMKSRDRAFRAIPFSSLMGSRLNKPQNNLRFNFRTNLLREFDDKNSHSQPRWAPRMTPSPLDDRILEQYQQSSAIYFHSNVGMSGGYENFDFNYTY